MARSPELWFENPERPAAPAASTDWNDQNTAQMAGDGFDLVGKLWDTLSGADKTRQRTAQALATTAQAQAGITPGATSGRGAFAFLGDPTPVIGIPIGVTLVVVGLGAWLALR